MTEVAVMGWRWWQYALIDHGLQVPTVLSPRQALPPPFSGQLGPGVWPMPVIPANRRLRQEDPKCKTRLGNLARPCTKKRDDLRGGASTHSSLQEKTDLDPPSTKRPPWKVRIQNQTGLMSAPFHGSTDQGQQGL